MKKNTKLNQANETISKLRQEVIVQKRLTEEANKRLCKSETSLFALQQDFSTKETTRKRVEADLLDRDRSLTDAEEKIRQAEIDLKNA